MRARLLVAILALVFFCTPIALRAAGVTAHPFENRPLATFPKLSQGWDAFDQATRFFVDRLPLREQAVRANTSIDRHVFHTTPVYGRAATGALPFGTPRAAPRSGGGQAGAAQGQPPPQVLAGAHGWLFLEAELQRACELFTVWPTAAHRWERLAQVIRASGRRVVIAVAPDKSAIYAEHLPADTPRRACAAAGHEAAWRAITRTHDPAIPDLRRLMGAAKRQPPQETYYRKDTHWNTKGGTIAVAALLRRLDAGATVAPAEIVRGTRTYTGDLTNLLGAPEQDVSPAWSIRRPGLAPASETTTALAAGGTARLLRRTAGGPPLIRGRTLFVHDSFGVAMLDALAAYTTELEVAEWYGPTPPASLVDAIRRADVVVLETVERDLNFKASAQGIVTPPFLADLRRALGSG